MATYNQWHVEELTLDLDSNTQGAIPIIYGRQGDKDGILCNIELAQQGVPVQQSWFANKRVYFEARGNGVSVRKQAEEIVDGVVKVVLPEAVFTQIGLVKDNFLRVEDATTGDVVISGTTSFQVYVRQGNLDPEASKFYLEEIESLANDFKKWFSVISNTVGKDAAATLARKVIELENEKVEVTEYEQNRIAVIDQLARTFKAGDTGVLSLNAFTETDRAIILGLAEGEINAVLGLRNVKPENTTFLEVSENLINPSLRKDGYMLGFTYNTDTTETYVASSQVTSYKNSFPTAVGDIIYSNAPGRLVWYASTNEVKGSTSFVLDESIGLFKATVGGGSKSKIDGYLDYINLDGYWFVSKNSVSKGKQEYGVTKLDSSIKSDVFLTKDDLEITDLTSFVPRNLYCFDSNKNSKWINKDNVLVSRNPNDFYLDMTAPNGALRDWNRVLTQTSDQLSVKSALTDETVYTKVYSRKSVDPSLKQNPSTQKNVLIIGDSYVDGDSLPVDIKNQIVNKYGFTNFNFIGTKVSTKTIDGVSVSCNNEGRGGYTIDDFTKTDNTQGRGSVFPNPFLENGIVDFSDYMTRNNITGSIDYVFINLGVNNLIMFGDSYETIKPKLQTLIDLIHADYPDCKIFINGLVMISKINGQYDVVFHNSKALGINKAFEELCESEANVSQCIYVDTAVFFDSEEGFQYEMQSYRGGTEEHKVQTDWLHPSDVGYYMIADTDVSAFVYYM